MSSIDNRYFPLKPGTAFHYEGVAENGKTPQTDDMFVTHQTKQILGVTSTVVRDIVSSAEGRRADLRLVRPGQAGKRLVHGRGHARARHGRFVKQSDSWEGGVNGAEPGIIMPGNPKPGDAYRQEYYPARARPGAPCSGAADRSSVRSWLLQGHPGDRGDEPED